MGKDFTNYGEIRIKRVPEELKERLRLEAKRLGINVRAVMLIKLWGEWEHGDLVGALIRGSERGISDGEMGNQECAGGNGQGDPGAGRA
jgi:hypothetical protein